MLGDSTPITRRFLIQSRRETMADIQFSPRRNSGRPFDPIASPRAEHENEETQNR